MTIHWFVTCVYTTTVRVAGECVRRPASTAHAKQMGGTVTACGEQTGNWAKLFDLPFPVTTGENCPACIAAIIQADRDGLGPRNRARTRGGPLVPGREPDCC